MTNAFRQPHPLLNRSASSMEERNGISSSSSNIDEMDMNRDIDKKVRIHTNFNRQKAKLRWSKLRSAVLGYPANPDKEVFPGFSSVLVSRQVMSSYARHRMMEVDQRLSEIRVSHRSNRQSKIRTEFNRYVLQMGLLAQAQWSCRNIMDSASIANANIESLHPNHQNRNPYNNSDMAANVKLISTGQSISTAIDLSQYLLRNKFVNSITQIKSGIYTNDDDHSSTHSTNSVSKETPFIEIYMDISTSTTIITDKETIDINIIKDVGEDCYNCEDKDENDVIQTPLQRFPCEGFVCTEYIIPSSSTSWKSGPIHVLTREKKGPLPGSSSKIDLKQLVSQRYVGVDNTGCIKVWDAAAVLAYCLLNENNTSDGLNTNCFGLSSLVNLASLPSYMENSCSGDQHIVSNNSRQRRNLRVIELGSGMAGIASLALAALSMSNAFVNKESNFETTIDVVMTDGHPECVNNNMVNYVLTSAFYDKVGWKNAKVERLLWKDNEVGARECALLTHKAKFHLCLVSDCLHFEDFHAALFATIGRLLDVNGVCILCQPYRGRSLSNFIKVVESVSPPLFDVELLDDYNTEVSRIRSIFASKYKSDFDANKHYPVMLILKLIRPYDERKDTPVAIDTQRKCRNNP